MDAIKKKMQAIKQEKDLAMDRADAMEQTSRDANARADRAQDEVDSLKKRTIQIEQEFEVTKVALETATQNLDTKEKNLLHVWTFPYFM